MSLFFLSSFALCFPSLFLSLVGLKSLSGGFYISGSSLGGAAHTTRLRHSSGGERPPLSQMNEICPYMQRVLVRCDTERQARCVCVCVRTHAGVCALPRRRWRRSGRLHPVDVHFWNPRKICINITSSDSVLLISKTETREHRRVSDQGTPKLPDVSFEFSPSVTPLFTFYSAIPSFPRFQTAEALVLIRCCKKTRLSCEDDHRGRCSLRGLNHRGTHTNTQTHEHTKPFWGFSLTVLTAVCFTNC